MKIFKILKYFNNLHVKTLSNSRFYIFTSERNYSFNSNKSKLSIEIHKNNYVRYYNGTHMTSIACIRSDGSYNVASGSICPDRLKIDDPDLFN